MRSHLLLLSLLAFPALALAQGSLTPPGAPAPTMKTLDQLEPRTPLRAGAPGVTVNANGSFIVSTPGSYYLTANLTVASGDGIILNAENITLDLNGFNLSSVAASATGAGVNIASQYNGITIRNGRILGATTQSNGVFAGGGFVSGIYGNALGVNVEDVDVSCVRYYGIVATRITRCTARVCGSDGLTADTVLDSQSTDCGGIAISGRLVINCDGHTISSTNIGILAYQLASNCAGYAIDGYGIACFANAVNCTGRSNNGYGLACNRSATNCTGFAIGGIGLFAGLSAENCYGFTNSGTWALIVANYNNPTILGTATNCFGDNEGDGTGLYADVASGCKGTSASGIGLRVVSSATGCTGTTASGTYGILAGGAVENCKATVSSGTGTALAAETAANCKAVATGGTAITCDTAQNCTASTTGGGVGLNAKVATGCYATSVDNTALRVDDIAENCRGTTTGAGYGLYAGNNALNCIGTTGTGAYGLYAVDTAQNCTGAVVSGTGTGLFAASASNCRGRANGGTGIQCETATGCSAKTTGTGIGIACSIASDCNATSVNGHAITAANADNCRGVASGSGYGLYCLGNAHNCTGSTYAGDYAIQAGGTASNCAGSNKGHGTMTAAVAAQILIGCTADSGGIIGGDYYNMPTP